MNYTWKTVYGDQRLVDLARELRGESADSSEEEEVNDNDDNSDDSNDSDDYEFVNEEDEDDNDNEEEEEDASSSEEEEVKESKFDKRWNDKYKQLKEYKAQHGDCDVPTVYKPNKALGKWVYKQRQEYRKMSEGLYSPMTQERVEKLENIGFSWVVLPSKDAWNERFEELKKFQAQTGHCTVPRQSNKTLGAWVRRQRCDYNLSKSLMTEERIEKLESIGFSWAPAEDTWNERFEKLKEFKTQQGHCNVPHKYQLNKALGYWVNNQREQYKLLSKGKKSSMTEQRVKKLENIGFMWNRLKDTWNERYEELKEYKLQYGNCNVPFNYELSKALGGWVIEQRQQYRKMSEGVYSFMTQERVAKLETLGFSWVLRSKDTWNERFEELKEFKAQQGHFNVPNKYDANKALGNWVQMQRQQYKRLSNGLKSTMTQERVEKLESIGFVWNHLNDTWEERYKQLTLYQSQNGHCNVSRANKSLCGWATSQREQYRKMSSGLKSQMTQERVEKLESLGFEWTPTEDAWNERFEELKEFKAQQGHCNVPHRYEPNKGLGIWVGTQRNQYKLMSNGSKSTMTQERVAKLESLGFVWNRSRDRLKDTWNERFEQLKEYKVQNGHCNVPTVYKPNKALFGWVCNQRRQYKLMSNGSKSTMTQERVEKLEGLGFVWNRSKDTWNERYEELKEYKVQNGHCNVPNVYEPNRALGSWVDAQRQQYRKMSQGLSSPMTQEREEKLESLDFEWVLRSKDTWNKRLAELKEFKAQYGHCNVPREYEQNKALGNWVHNQRQKYSLLSKGTKSSMTQEQVKKLESISFEWTPIEDIWHRRLQELTAYQAQHGHCNVPNIYEPNRALGNWVQNQRQQRQLWVKGSPSYMTQERVEMLENIGFEWSPSKDIWDVRFQELELFKAQHKHCNVPWQYEPNKAIFTWVCNQRTQYRLMCEGAHSNMTRERVEKLESIGFEWSRSKKSIACTKKYTWDERLGQLKRFKAQYGHCNVPSIYEPNKSLGFWVGTQRKQYNRMLEGAKSNMTEERVEKLENIGFEWRSSRKRIARKNATAKKRSKKSIASKNPTVKRSSKKRVARKNATIGRRSKRLKSKK
ncbi:hypothetical protein CTEN210_18467 [Chaetoceros tenuissimus]|uniref:Helicase-associated domain-containing protein n=1 Tax=Chaetoceros tenuissimus TaxID=426638 RepID=A0AAD3DCW9_9STRA|nr:hypothetical protein CTEN210_18467 [Chaetoceros tenuissimus]